MEAQCSRRALLAGFTTLCGPLRTGAATMESAVERIAAIERRDGGRLGVAVLDAQGGLALACRAQERFPLCSTFKLLAAAAVLKLVDEGKETLDRQIAYGPDDLCDYAPVTRRRVGEGGVTLGDLCAAALNWSDNTAANLLLRLLGGPEGVTRYARSLGDAATRLDRDEPALNEALPGDERDTTTPLAMARDLRLLLLGDSLSPASRQQLETWLIDDKVGDKRLRAGLPPAGRIGDKTGSGGHGTANVVAILWPPERPPLIAAVYYTGSPAAAETRDAALAQIGAMIARRF